MSTHVHPVFKSQLVCAPRSQPDPQDFAWGRAMEQEDWDRGGCGILTFVNTHYF